MEINIDDSWSVEMTAPASLFDLSPKLDVEPVAPHQTCITFHYKDSFIQYIKTPRSSPHSDAGGARARRRRLFLWSLMLSFDSYHLSAAFFIFFKFSLPDLTPSISVATRRSQLTGTVLFSGGSRRACACASLTFPLSLFTRMLYALGFRSLIFNRRWPSHPLNKRYAVLKVDGSSASLVSVNLNALSNLPPDCSLQPNHILCRVLSLKRSLSDTHAPPVLVHWCLVASYPYVSTNGPSSADKALPTVDVLTCDKTIPPSSSIKHYNSSSAQSSSALWYPSNVSLRSGWSIADVSPSSFTAWAMPMENIQDVSPSFSPAFVGETFTIIPPFGERSKSLGLVTEQFIQLKYYFAILRSGLYETRRCKREYFRVSCSIDAFKLCFKSAVIFLKTSTLLQVLVIEPAEESRFLSRSASDIKTVTSTTGTRLSHRHFIRRRPHKISGDFGCSQRPAVKPPPLNLTGKGSPFFITGSNRLVSVGCDARALVTDIESQIIGCESSCDGNNKSRSGKICGGYRCCQAVITADKPQVIGIGLESSGGGDDCKVAFLTNETYYPANVREAEEIYSKGFSVVELGWFFDSRLRDPVGCVNLTETGIYTSANRAVGNPYLPGGCVDIDECEEGKGRNSCGEQTCVNVPGLVLGLALLFLVLGIWGLIKFVKKRRKIIQKRKFFKRNGGLLLKQQLTTQGGNVETSKIFTSKELEKATDSFNKNRVLGQGGQGTVYKGMLVDGRIVVVKRSKVLDEDKVEEFINEVSVLSQTNHRNVVKLMGCCLETEIAGALAYLHSAASTPVYHRDIKTTNILLDEKYRAKVSDFGTSRSINIDQTHLTTLVAGTFGYLDPEYFQTSQFTDKSDVYSFGVVLVELITGEKPFSVMRSEENRGLASHFNEAMKENRVLDIVDSRIKEECKQEQVLAVAKLARRCLSLKGKKRPSMREVSIELERIRSSPEDLEVTLEEEEEEEEREMEINIDDSWSVEMTAPASLFDLSPKLDVEPVAPHQT
ncbi:hypothetical protein F2Q69_00051889 [Brassica cretica]|uniref:Protein kinase domain-containing protein n=1 Tax=Brassica cretica TaxID=69181 RepID=A0A8S9PHK1_BRACR|nr:hypothetical protein F2Q69_00051889 [Brassica cretica]